MVASQMRERNWNVFGINFGTCTLLTMGTVMIWIIYHIWSKIIIDLSIIFKSPIYILSPPLSSVLCYFLACAGDQVSSFPT